jgi:hypothetical protein
VGGGGALGFAAGRLQAERKIKIMAKKQERAFILVLPE